MTPTPTPPLASAAPPRLRVDSAAATLTVDGTAFPCVLGRSGVCPAEAKREGDGCTPLGRWAVRAALLRPGRVAPEAAPAIPWRWTRPGDGWSDDTADPAYNRPVALPRPFSHEQLQREDAAYDIILVLGHNDAPPVPGQGSAIFWHIWRPRDDGSIRPTEGCIAVSRETMDAVLPRLRPGTMIDIV